MVTDRPSGPPPPVPVTVRRPAPLLADTPALAGLLAAHADRAGPRALSEHKWLDVTRGGQGGSAGLLVEGADPGTLAAYAHLSAHGDEWGLEIVAPPELEPVLLRRALAEAAGAPVHWWVYGAGPRHDAVAAAAGLTVGRDLLQMRCPLPPPGAASVDAVAVPPATRLAAFRPGTDDDAWLAVNARAFADHPEQGRIDHPALAERLAEPWFDASGFLLAWDERGLAGSCWVKPHGRPGEPGAEGEIYAVGVDPDRRGTGLGRALTLAGLAWMHEQGFTTGMLYVDGANAAPVGLYTSLGFTVAVRNRAYVGRSAPGHPGETAP